jgi:hypothetical protein
LHICLDLETDDAEAAAEKYNSNGQENYSVPEKHSIIVREVCRQGTYSLALGFTAVRAELYQ